eukprot:CAMPEP_0197294784 /NCGR_PEP_ID=MMETSP0890-20130614/33584_1 /TAXON_ID=44058 ORGANISM="Aureoumbra lagunensis, Strain CCMP1510" /NCGR_SAMPLE_ID=MMETSP0890 /ASSEMBLY_ACC=CAM_ASM_000533 /LENGTH=187 /DNA_ID=CAMNT_0042770393 /DNA_START=32 /DNA_END=595 /DNA_ORIENTATION=-
MTYPDEEGYSKNVAAKEEEAALSYLRVVQCETEQEELLDRVAILERRIRLMRKDLVQTRQDVVRIRKDTTNARQETKALKKEAEAERVQHEALERELERHKKSNGHTSDEQDDQVLDQLILVKTKLAQAMEEQERRKLEKKKLEEELAKLKCNFATSMAELTDEEERRVRNALKKETIQPGSLPSVF